MLRGLSHHLVCLALLAITSQVGAVQVEKLYEISVPVADSGGEARADGLAVAMQRMVVRISGSEEYASRAGMSKQYEAPTKYVQQFRYFEQNDAAQEGESRLQLWVQFNRNELVSLLQAQGIPVWGGNRPLTVAWIVVDDGKSRKLLDASYADPLKDSTEQSAMLRGLPITWPAYDLQDRELVSLIDVWGGIEEPLLLASRRYQADAVLMGRLVNDGRGGWYARWRLLTGGERAVWEAQGYLSEEVLSSGIQKSADFLSVRFAQTMSADTGGEFILQVDGIYRLAEYAELTQFVSELAPVKRVFPKRIDSDRVRLQIAFNGSQPVLEELLQLGGRLLPVDRGDLVYDGLDADFEQLPVVRYRLTQ
jgi:hypothetical protein